MEDEHGAQREGKWHFARLLPSRGKSKPHTQLLAPCSLLWGMQDTHGAAPQAGMLPQDVLVPDTSTTRGGWGLKMGRMVKGKLRHRGRGCTAPQGGDVQQG